MWLNYDNLGEILVFLQLGLPSQTDLIIKESF